MKYKFDTDRLMGWRELPIGAIIPEGGTSERYETGSWRTERPVLDPERCTSCLICWIFCPDSSIIVKDGKMIGFDLDHCKGCGICARECPPKFSAIRMVSESKFHEEG